MHIGGSVRVPVDAVERFVDVLRRPARLVRLVIRRRRDEVPVEHQRVKGGAVGPDDRAGLCVDLNDP